MAVRRTSYGRGCPSAREKCGARWNEEVEEEVTLCCGRYGDDVVSEVSSECELNPLFARLHHSTPTPGPSHAMTRVSCAHTQLGNFLISRVAVRKRSSPRKQQPQRRGRGVPSASLGRRHRHPFRASTRDCLPACACACLRVGVGRVLGMRPMHRRPRA